MVGHAQQQVTLRSGEWEWHVVELRDVPTGRVDSHHVYLRPPDVATSVMRLRLPGDVELDAEALTVLARHPRDRELLGPDGAVWHFYPVSRSPVAMGVPLDFTHPPYEVVFRSDQGGHGRGHLPPECGLGDATDQELLRLVEGAL